MSVEYRRPEGEFLSLRVVYFEPFNGNAIKLAAPYDPVFLQKLKTAFTDSERHYDSKDRVWYIRHTPENYRLLKDLAEKHFLKTEPKLVVFSCYGDTPTINGTPVIDYGRDYDRANSAWNFRVIAYKRTGRSGSRKNPEFYGIVIAKVHVNGETKISGWHKMFPYFRALQIAAVDIAEKTGWLWEPMIRELEKAAERLKETSVKFEETATVVKGFLVLSELPSKALLDKILPKEYKGKVIGNEVISIVRGYFYNKLGTLSRKFYSAILKRHAVWAGFGYIVPGSRVADFIEDIEALREEYEEFERELREFLTEGKIPEDKLDKVEKGRIKIDREYLDVVRDYLEQHGITEIEVPEISKRVKIRLVPFSVSTEVIEEYIDERARELIEGELESLRREMAENLKKQLEERVDDIVERLQKYEKTRMTKRLLKKLKEDVEFVAKTAEELGVKIERINALKKFVEAVEDEKGEIKVDAEAEGRLKALIKEISS